MVHATWSLFGLFVGALLVVTGSIFLGSFYMPKGPISKLIRTPTLAIDMEGIDPPTGLVVVVTGIRLTQYDQINITATPLTMDEDGEVLSRDENQTEVALARQRYALQTSLPLADAELNVTASYDQDLYAYDCRVQFSFNRTLMPDTLFVLWTASGASVEVTEADLPYTHELGIRMGAGP